MLNRATMRVADTTEVCGRVTADSREKQTMKPTIRRCLALAIAFLGLYLGLSVCGLAQNDQGQNDQGTGIKLGVPNGTYAVQESGYVTDASGNLVALQVAGQITFSADGKVTALSSFSVPGIPPFSRVGASGTFKVNGAGGATVGTGKYLEVWRRAEGKWLMIRDVWNNDAPATVVTTK